ncbi:MAG: DUF1194 domain-containing protein [Rubrivivax sp.]|nr:DUF1194 domain-containing protein [Rubrivivax sp.]
MKIRSLVSALASATSALFGASQVQAAPVDLALSLVIDVSGSVSTDEYNLQMDGYANAFRDAGIQANMLGGTNGTTAVNVIFFASDFFTSTLDNFVVLSSAAQINAFADVLDAFARVGGGGTAIHTGTNRAIDLLLAATAAGGALEGTNNMVIDVSGDGGGNAASDIAARNRATANNMTINGLPIGGTSINNYYLTNVITTDGFIEPASNFTDFSDAVRRKLFVETGGTIPEPGSIALVLLALGAAGAARRRSA